MSLLKCKSIADNQIIGIQRGIVFDKDDFNKMQDYMKNIRLYNFLGDHDSAFNLSALLNIYIRRQYNDHKPSILHKTKIEAKDADISTNKITAPGAAACILILTGLSNKFFNWMSMGKATAPETIGQRKLIDERIRIPILVNGSVAAHGLIWNHVGNMGYGPPTDTYYEFGIHDGPIEPTTMLSRSVISGGLAHIQNQSFLTASHSSIFVPK